MRSETRNRRRSVTEPDENGVYRVDEAYAWLEQESSIMFKAVTDSGDPLELTAHDARELSQVLLKLAEALERIDG
jgi:hypothetical protein